MARKTKRIAVRQPAPTPARAHQIEMAHLQGRICNESEAADELVSQHEALGKIIQLGMDHAEGDTSLLVGIDEIVRCLRESTAMLATRLRIIGRPMDDDGGKKPRKTLGARKGDLPAKGGIGEPADEESTPRPTLRYVPGPAAIKTICTPQAGAVRIPARPFLGGAA